MKYNIVFRNGLPETNSSSSHSVVINQLGNKKYENTDIGIDENGIIKIPSGINFEFGRTSFSHHNDFKTKVAFIISLGIDTGKPVKKFLKQLKSIICSYTGAKDVIFEGIEKYNTMYKENFENGCIEDYYGNDMTWMMYDLLETAFGSVDHQSRDISEHVFENKNTLKNFLFNPDSWLLLGDDCTDVDYETRKLFKQVYKTDPPKNKIYSANIDFGYNLGRIDFLIDNISDKDFITRNIFEGRDKLIQELIFDIVEKKFTTIDYNSYNSNNINNYLAISSILPSSGKIVIHSDGPYIYFANDKFQNLAGKIIGGNIENSRPWLRTYLGSKIGEVCEEVIKDPSIVEEIDYLRFKINLNIKELGL